MIKTTAGADMLSLPIKKQKRENNYHCSLPRLLCTIKKLKKND